eukprot:1943960-Amphidinium_carterae.1
MKFKGQSAACDSNLDLSVGHVACSGGRVGKVWCCRCVIGAEIGAVLGCFAALGGCRAGCMEGEQLVLELTADGKTLEDAVQCLRRRRQTFCQICEGMVAVQISQLPLSVRSLRNRPHGARIWWRTS